MKILPQNEYGYSRELWFCTDSNSGAIPITLGYSCESNYHEDTIIDGTIIPCITRAVNNHDALLLAMKAAVLRVKMANEAGDPILSAWRVDAEKLLDSIDVKE